jgi:glucose-6-phosphate dehydrogenase assembly protein OpcA
VSDDVWSAQDTTPDAIDAALRDLLRRRHATNRALAPARVLNLVVVVDRSWKGEIANRLDRVGRYHASRTILCAVEDGRNTIDAVAVMSYDEPTNGLGVMRESVEIDIGPDHLATLGTIVDPVVVSELPTMLWCPHGHDEALWALLDMVDVILLDSDDEADCIAAVVRAAELLKSAYVVDLAWLRTTPWRERLAASFDTPERLAALGQLGSVSVRHRTGSRASAMLLAGWLASRLHWDVETLRSTNGAGLRGRVSAAGGEIEVSLEPSDQDVPGLVGVTVSWGQGRSLSLDRARGGLRARERSASGERTWQILGASRGEGGILGEGVRQALLRDPTYGPALEQARSFCP